MDLFCRPIPSSQPEPAMEPISEEAALAPSTNSAFRELLRQVEEEHERELAQVRGQADALAKKNALLDRSLTLLEGKQERELSRQSKISKQSVPPTPMDSAEMQQMHRQSTVDNEGKPKKTSLGACMIRQSGVARTTEDLLRSDGSGMLLQKVTSGLNRADGTPRRRKERGGDSPNMVMGRQAAVARSLRDDGSPMMGRASSTSEVRGFMSADALAKLKEENMKMKKAMDQPPQDYVKLHPQWLLDAEAIHQSGGFAFALPSTLAVKNAKRLLSPADDQPTSLASRLLPHCKFIQALETQLQLAWDFMGILCILFDLIWIPVQIGFEVENLPGLLSIEWLVRMFWTSDFLIKFKQFFKPSPMGRRMICTKGNLARTGWLFFDGVIVWADWLPVLPVRLPIFVSEDESGDANLFGLLRIGKIPRILRILRVLRLARMMKLEHFFFALRDSLLVSSESVSLTLGVLKNMVCILLLCHICTCVWYFVGLGDSDEHWVHFHGLSGPDTPLMVKYLWSFHWVAAQWTPAAMEVLPRNVFERAFNAVLVVGGVITWSTFMGAITASMTRLRNINGNELSHFFLLRHYLYENGISRSLTVRICRYADLALEMHRKRINQESVRHLKLLSGPLHVELQKEIYLPHLCKHGFFHGYYDWDPAAMSQLCFQALGREFVAKGDILFSLGAEANRMYCPVTGTFIYQRRRGIKVPRGTLRPKRTARIGIGTWFCEASLWVRWHHLGSMCALIESEIVQVDAAKFREVTLSRESVFSRSALYARAYSRTMYDDHGFAWDVPTEILYHSSDEHNANKYFWWQKEVVEAEIEEAKWLAAHGDSESENSEEEDYSEGSGCEEVHEAEEEPDYLEGSVMEQRSSRSSRRPAEEDPNLGSETKTSL